jgi:hypothetical protein
VSREDANLIIAMAGLFVALVATGAAIYAIRRDRADLRVTTSDAGAGNRWVTVVNVGLRPVRIERILVRRWRLVPRLGKVIAIGASVMRAGGQEEPLPTVIQPAAEVSLHYWPAEYGEFVGPHEPDLLVEDASGRRYAVRNAPDVHLGPPRADERADE